MANNLLEFTGLRELEPLEQTIIKGLANEYFPKIQREAKNDIDLLVHVKVYEKEGKRSKYSVHLKCIYATKVLDVNKVADWDLPRGVHEAFVALLNMLRKRTKNFPGKYKLRKSQNKKPKQVKRRLRKVKKSKKKSSVKKRALKKRGRTY